MTVYEIGATAEHSKKAEKCGLRSQALHSHSSSTGESVAPLWGEAPEGSPLVTGHQHCAGRVDSRVSTVVITV